MNNLTPYQVCTFCVMDTTAPEISFDSEGRCNFCKSAERQLEENLKRISQPDYSIERRVEEIKKRNKNKPYDAITGLSGGVDSSYSTYLAHKYGLRLLAVHCDTGWNSDEATANIHSIVNKLGIDLETYVVPWEIMRELQVAFFKASVPNCDIPQDHAIVAVNNSISDKVGVRDFISGGNLASESILPSSWGHDARDLKHLKAILNFYSNISLKGYPKLNGFESYFYLPFIKGIRNYRILNDITYSRNEAIKTLQEEFGWRNYGGKHHESVFTKFYQAYYLPTKFLHDKRKPHFSSLITATQMTRSEAIFELSQPTYKNTSDLERDTKYFCQKLKISEEEWDVIMKSPPQQHNHYPTNESWKKKLDKIKNFIESHGIKIRRSW